MQMLCLMLCLPLCLWLASLCPCLGLPKIHGCCWFHLLEWDSGRLLLNHCRWIGWRLHFRSLIQSVDLHVRFGQIYLYGKLGKNKYIYIYISLFISLSMYCPSFTDFLNSDANRWLWSRHRHPESYPSTCIPSLLWHDFVACLWWGLASKCLKLVIKPTGYP